MEVLPSSSSFGDEDNMNLEQLLHAFGSAVSLEDIASAYCKAGRNLSIAGDILCNLQATKSTASRFESKNDFDSMETTSSQSLDNFSRKDQINPSKPKKCAASMGIVPNVIRRESERPGRLKDETCKTSKPLKLNIDDFPISEIWKEDSVADNSEKAETLRLDVEEFLFKMLGDGFSLNMSTIHNVVGQCGYDVNKSMDTLMDLSAETLGKCDDIVGIHSEKHRDLKSNSSQDSAGSSNSNNAAVNGDQLPKKGKSKYELQKEILSSLFVLPGRYDEAKIIRPSKEVRRTRNVVDKPLQLPQIDHRTVIKQAQASEMNDDEEDEESYEVLRKAVREYWTIMKEYYKAAFEAYIKKEHTRAYDLLDEGDFFRKKAREADEKSAQKLIQPSCAKEDVIFDMLHFEPKEAIRFLKLQLTTYSGIPSVQFIRVIVGANDDDAKGLRKRLIVKLLGRESITWTEEDNGKTLVIKVDEINPQNLSFFKRSTASGQSSMD